MDRVNQTEPSSQPAAKTERFHIALTAEEVQELDALAKEWKCSKAEVIRRSLSHSQAPIAYMLCDKFGIKLSELTDDVLDPLIERVVEALGEAATEIFRRRLLVKYVIAEAEDTRLFLKEHAGEEAAIDYEKFARDRLIETIHKLGWAPPAAAKEQEV